MHNASGGELFSHRPDPRGARSAGLAALGDALNGLDPARRPDVDHWSASLMRVAGDTDAKARCALLAKACFYYQRIGRSVDGIAPGVAARELARRHRLKDLERRACDVLSTAYLDVADFEEACKCLERALLLARELDDPSLVSHVYATTGALFKEMGCYLDALAVIDRSLESAATTPEALAGRFTAATNGLFCAHRLRDEDAALRYLTIAVAIADHPPIDAVARATFEHHRAVYLIAHDDGATAAMLVHAAGDAYPAVPNARVEMLSSIAKALCDWSSRVPAREAAARRDLRELYHRSRQTRLYHDDVLRALMQVYSRPASRGDAAVGVTYANELVDYTTKVKHAKFYRQMSDQAVPATSTDPGPPGFDPFASARRWLIADKVALPKPPGADGRPGRPHDIRKHDELTAIHDDLAAMRTASLKTSIRTVAYAMAEDWALAAEFFDDQTGQHCFRVGRLAGLLAAELGLDAGYCKRIEHAARLHDIGKITVNEVILLKPGPLDPGELSAMRAHAEVGGFLLQYADDPTLRMASVIARHHHEWWNGTGYPHNLAGERIPLEARICALADVYDALTSARPYKRPWPHAASVEQMLGESGAHFDPRLMAAFLRVLEREVGSNAAPPQTQMHLNDIDASGLLASRRQLISTINDQ